MTQQKHFKALVRARMARTGERYAVARAHLRGSLDAFEIEQVAEFRAHDRHAIALAFTPDGSELLSGGFGGQAHIWSTDDWSPAGELVGHTGSVNGFAIDATGQRAATVSSDATSRLWDLPRRRELAVLRGHAKGVVSIDLAPDGTITTGGYDGTIRKWSAGGDQLGRTKVGGRAVALAHHPVEPWLAASIGGAEVVILEADGTECTRLATGDVVSAVRWTADGSFLLAGSCAGVEIWTAGTWESARTITLDDASSSAVPIATSPDSALVAAGWAHHVGIWRADAEQPAVILDGLPRGVYGLAFAPDGSLLAQGGADGIVRAWHLGG